ncbi:proline-, glutamic acid- and leucine-rich protein 1-like [Poecilia reticulata]|uniref:proline-, glutamic acid- and leucine-rich protein 1-like n=1 Tax=Poecilia reticulata TaxID=8081 RepID=UPI0004A2A6F1|nr:PREDICTED: proline-, glutamic acid- and leucine-rich protein 1-like [Poecilia reticulata]
MRLLNVALLLVVLLTATMEAKPIRHRHDADIPDKNQPQRYLAELSEGSEESEEEEEEEEEEEGEEKSSEEETEEEEEEEEEEVVVDVTEAATIPPLLVVTTDSLTFTSGDGSTLAPEPDTANTAGPVIMVRETTPGPAVTGVTADVTTAGVVPTSLRATSDQMRGDI